METEYYNRKEIEEMFRMYRSIEHASLTEKEFALFCEAISYLPRNIVDIVDKEIYFVLLSLGDATAQIDCQSACYTSLIKDFPEGKNAIIVITALTFIKRKKGIIGIILHEIAHHVLGTTTYRSLEDKEAKEYETDLQVSKWIAAILNESPGPSREETQP